MIIKPNDLNIFKVMQDKIEYVTKYQIEEKLVKKFMDPIEKEIRAKIKDITSKIVIDNIKNIKDHQIIRDELIVYISINGDECAKKILD